MKKPTPEPPKLEMTRSAIIAVVKHTGKKIGLNYTDAEAIWVWGEWPEPWKRKVVVNYLWDKIRDMVMLIVHIKFGG